MAAISRKPIAVEFGDYQTPPGLADQVCRLLEARAIAPNSIVEPTCGIGNFLIAALDRFPAARHAVAVEINPEYVDRLLARLQRHPGRERVRVLRESFFQADWPALLRELPDPVLVVGNPPWVTNSEVGALGGSNLPRKSNFQNHSGLDALTGKSNFDISEWMLIRLLELLRGRTGALAMLCKTAVARKVLRHAWHHGFRFDRCEMHRIDAAAHFNASVDACLLLCIFGPSAHGADCRVFQSLGASAPASAIGCRSGQLVADVTAYERWRHLEGEEEDRWRSGVKHDCAKVMELRKEGSGFRNGLGEFVELEPDYVFPMLKSSELANGHTAEPARWMLVTQRCIGGDTREIRVRAPRTWDYLQSHAPALDRRASSIYRNRPRFSVFGVGDYSFAPWKVAISGFYKRLAFTVVGSHAGKPVVFDDTAYFIPCGSEDEARTIGALLNSPAAREFYSAFIFWDAKRPITIDLLRRLDLSALARDAGLDVGDGVVGLTESSRARSPQLSLFGGA
jgi:hypothetical protein